MKLEQEPRLQGLGLPAGLIEWARRVTGAVNPLLDAAAVPAAPMSLQPSFRNLAINGKAMANQYSNVVTGGGGYICDMWSAFNGGGGGVVTGAVVSAVGLSEFPNFVRLTSGAANAAVAGSYWPVSTSIEGCNLAGLNWGTVDAKPMTVSFWARSTVGGTYSLALRNGTNALCYAAPFTLAASTWTKITKTIPGPTTGTWDIAAGVGVNVNVCWGIGTTYGAPTPNAWIAGNYLGLAGQSNAMAVNGAECDVTGFQPEAGVIATPFEHRLYPAEIAMAQRYYYVAQKLWGATTGGSGGRQIGRMGANLPTPMRLANPPLSIAGTVFLYDGGSGSTLTAITANYSTPGMIEFDGLSVIGVFTTAGRICTTNSGSAGNGVLADCRL